MFWRYILSFNTPHTPCWHDTPDTQNRSTLISTDTLNNTDIRKYIDIKYIDYAPESFEKNLENNPEITKHLGFPLP